MRPITDNALVLGNLREYRRKWYSAKSHILLATFLPQKVWCIFNHFYVMNPESYRIWWNNAM